jgi:hypothetical protein
MTASKAATMPVHDHDHAPAQFPRPLRRRALDRRTLLKAAGVALALPLLDALCPALARAGEGAGAAAPRRFVGMLTNMGILPENFYPKEAGKDYTATPYLELLKGHRDALTVFSGVSLPGVDGGHASERCFLSAAPGASRGSFRNSVSLDQVMAENLGAETRFPSLTLMVGSEDMSISYTRSGAMIPPVKSALKLYQQLFVESTPEAKLAAHERLKADRSLLDGLRERTKALEQGVGASDRQELDQYFSAIRDLEKRLTANETWVDRPKPKPGSPAPEEISDAHRLVTTTRSMLAMVRLALVADSTRVVTVSFSTGSLTPREIPGVNTMVHEMTHHGHRAAVMAELAKVETAQFTELATFLDGLRAVKQGERTLLDQTSVLFGTNMGSANSHANDNLPVLLAGGGFKHVGHLVFDTKSNYPLSNLYVSLLQRIGINATSFASGSGPMKGIELA